jgi:hypothetical protein
VPTAQEVVCAPGVEKKTVEKISAPPGLDLRTIQLVASRYIDYAVPVHQYDFMCGVNCVFE